MPKQYPSYPFCAKEQYLTTAAQTFTSCTKTSTAHELPPLLLAAPASHRTKNKTPTLLLSTTRPHTHCGSLGQPPLRQDWKEQLAQGVANLGFILKASCGCEWYFSLTPVIHSTVFSSPAEPNHAMACFKEKTVTHKQLFTPELNTQEERKNMLLSTEKSLYVSPRILIPSDLFCYTATRPGKLVFQVSQFSAI